MLCSVQALLDLGESTLPASIIQRLKQFPKERPLLKHDADQAAKVLAWMLPPSSRRFVSPYQQPSERSTKATFQKQICWCCTSSAPRIYLSMARKLTSFLRLQSATLMSTAPSWHVDSHHHTLQVDTSHTSLVVSAMVVRVPFTFLRCTSIHCRSINLLLCHLHDEKLV